MGGGLGGSVGGSLVGGEVMGGVLVGGDLGGRVCTSSFRGLVLGPAVEVTFSRYCGRVFLHNNNNLVCTLNHEEMSINMQFPSTTGKYVRPK